MSDKNLLREQMKQEMEEQEWRPLNRRKQDRLDSWFHLASWTLGIVIGFLVVVELGWQLYLKLPK